MNKPRPLNWGNGRPSRGASLPRSSPITPDNSPVPANLVIEHPILRGECQDGPRPCPLVGCPHNNYLEVTQYGTVKLFFPNREPHEVPPDESCDLDVANEGIHTLDQVAHILGLTRERIRQIEQRALAKALRTLQENDKEL